MLHGPHYYEDPCNIDMQVLFIADPFYGEHHMEVPGKRPYHFCRRNEVEFCGALLLANRYKSGPLDLK